MRFDEKYADLLDTLSAKDRRAVTRAVTNGMLEGWEPSRAEVELQVRACVERMTAEQFDAELDKLITASRGSSHAVL